LAFYAGAPFDSCDFTFLRRQSLKLGKKISKRAVELLPTQRLYPKAAFMTATPDDYGRLLERHRQPLPAGPPAT
jgi:hypothetical protein